MIMEEKNILELKVLLMTRKLECLTYYCNGITKILVDSGVMNEKKVKELNEFLDSKFI
tara:strand:- start:20068 stop:20241 length:174 start_codon:yes stop_codon:yes gene_type:complete